MEINNSELTNSARSIILRAVEREVKPCCFDMSGELIDLTKAKDKESHSYLSNDKNYEHLKEIVLQNKGEDSCSYLNLEQDLNLLGHYLVADNLVIETNRHILTVAGIIANNIFILNSDNYSNKQGMVVSGLITANFINYVGDNRIICNCLRTNDLVIRRSQIEANYWDRSYSRFSSVRSTIEYQKDDCENKNGKLTNDIGSIVSYNIDVFKQFLDLTKVCNCIFNRHEVEVEYAKHKQKLLGIDHDGVGNSDFLSANDIVVEDQLKERQHKQLLAAVKKIETSIKNQAGVGKFMLNRGIKELFDNELSQELCAKFLEFYNYKDVDEVISDSNQKNLKELIVAIIIDFDLADAMNKLK